MEHQSKLLDFKSQWGGEVYIALISYYKAGHRKFFVDMNYPDNISAVEAIVQLRKVLPDVRLSVTVSDITYGNYYKELIELADTQNNNTEKNNSTHVRVRIVEGKYVISVEPKID